MTSGINFTTVHSATAWIDVNVAGLLRAGRCSYQSSLGKVSVKQFVMTSAAHSTTLEICLFVALLLLLLALKMQV